MVSGLITEYADIPKAPLCKQVASNLGAGAVGDCGIVYTKFTVLQSLRLADSAPPFAQGRLFANLSKICPILGYIQKNKKDPKINEKQIYKNTRAYAGSFVCGPELFFLLVGK